MTKINVVFMTLWLGISLALIFSVYQFKKNKLAMVTSLFNTPQDTAIPGGTQARILNSIQTSIAEIIDILKVKETCRGANTDIKRNSDKLDKLLKVLKFLPENLSIELSNVAQGMNSLLEMDELEEETDNHESPSEDNNKDHASVFTNYSLPTNLDNSSILAAESSFFSFLTKLDALCPTTRRMGTVQPGGWDICVSPPFVPRRTGCLVYSFGINYDFSFDADMVDSYQCKVRSYDPSMNDFLYGLLKQGQSVQVSHKLVFYKAGIGNTNGLKDHVGTDRVITKWLLKTFGTFLKDNNEDEAIIDVLKIDVEFAEWESLEAILKEGSLKHVKQFVIEIHTPETFKDLYPTPSVEKYQEMFHILRQLEELGFRKYYVHHNHFCKGVSRATGKTIESCYEVSYLNSHFIKTDTDSNTA